MVVFIGDSITHGTRWHRHIYDYYLTRFPDRKIRFVDAGVSGDTAAGAVARLDSDILPVHPSVAVVMLGMNDVKRNLYAGEPAGEATLAARSKALDDYRDNMRTLAARLSAAGVRRFVFVVSSPFDETARIPAPNLPGVNGALAATLPILRELAAETAGSVVDFQGPMTEINRERQRDDPAYTLIGPDRVHPRDAGHLVMAFLFLKAQGLPSLVSNISPPDCSGCRISRLTRAPGRLSFTVLEDALPFPVDDEAKAALSLVPIEAQLDQEILTVADLPPGSWRLTIDGEPAGEFSAEALRRGVNLALDRHTPQFRQAGQVAALADLRRAAGSALRDVVKVEEGLLRRPGVPLEDPALVRQYAGAYLAKLSGQPAAFSRGSYLFKQYFLYKPLVPDLRRRIDELTLQLYQVNQPLPHCWELTRKELP